MYNASDIAKWFIIRNKVDLDSGITDELMTNLKIQKLLYYAQGCVLAVTDDPLFDDEIYAWEHGPVVPSVYREYKKYGRNGIRGEDLFLEKMREFSKKIIEILEYVYDEFGQFSAIKLRNMTHNEKPWIVTKKNDIIDKNVIKEYFKRTYVET